MQNHQQKLDFNKITLTTTDAFQQKIFAICHIIYSFYKHKMHEKNQRPNMFVSFALLDCTKDVDFAYWPLLQMLHSPNAYF